MNEHSLLHHHQQQHPCLSCCASPVCSRRRRPRPLSKINLGQDITHMFFPSSPTDFKAIANTEKECDDSDDNSTPFCNTGGKHMQQLRQGFDGDLAPASDQYDKGDGDHDDDEDCFVDFPFECSSESIDEPRHGHRPGRGEADWGHQKPQRHRWGVDSPSRPCRHPRLLQQAKEPVTMLSWLDAMDEACPCLGTLRTRADDWFAPYPSPFPTRPTLHSHSTGVGSATNYSSPTSFSFTSFETPVRGESGTPSSTKGTSPPYLESTSPPCLESISVRWIAHQHDINGRDGNGGRGGSDKEFFFLGNTWRATFHANGQGGHSFLLTLCGSPHLFHCTLRGRFTIAPYAGRGRKYVGHCSTLVFGERRPRTQGWNHFISERELERCCSLPSVGDKGRVWRGVGDGDGDEGGERPLLRLSVAIVALQGGVPYHSMSDPHSHTGAASPASASAAIEAGDTWPHSDGSQEGAQNTPSMKSSGSTHAMAVAPVSGDHGQEKGKGIGCLGGVARAVSVNVFVCHDVDASETQRLVSTTSTAPAPIPDGPVGPHWPDACFSWMRQGGRYRPVGGSASPVTTASSRHPPFGWQMI